MKSPINCPLLHALIHPSAPPSHSSIPTNQPPLIYIHVSTHVHHRHHPCIHSSMHACTHPPMHPSTHPPFHLFTHTPIHPCSNAPMHAPMESSTHQVIHSPTHSLTVHADLAALANEYAPKFKGHAKADIVKAILEEQYGKSTSKSTSVNQSSNKLTSTQVTKRQELIEARRGMLIEAKCLRVRKAESRMQGHFFAFLVELGWHTENRLPLDIMQTCISSLSDGDYKTVKLIMALAQFLCCH